MKFYEVFLRLINHGKDIGRTCIQIQAKSPFTASLEAENIVDENYGSEIYSATVSVAEITKDEFLFQTAC